MQQLSLYNSLSRKKEVFNPIHENHVGMYVCGPTVYSDVHLGNARTFLSFDLIYRYLLHIGYTVRYVRNITDVGHLVGDADEGEDKIAKKARLERLEPMEIVQRYTNDFHNVTANLNMLSPSIEPTATGHIIEQIELIKKIIGNGLAYEVNGSVYFDVEKYAKTENYGELSGRKIEDLISNTRDLDGQTDKRSPLDFALWKKAAAEHIMRWPSPWSDGFPGWHLECSIMSTKYLGETFDIHGGGMDLKFPHHECEIAQCKAGNEGKAQANYWLHTNMLTVNGTKMSKSLDNSFLPNELFTGDHKLLEQGYSPMTVRFFMLQTHYSSTLDFSNDALKAAEKGYKRLMSVFVSLGKITPANESNVDVISLTGKCYAAMNDDINTPIALSHLFEAVKWVNQAAKGDISLTQKDIESLSALLNTFVFDIFGLLEEAAEQGDLSSALIEKMLAIRVDAKKNKDFQLSDKIRNELLELNISIKDSREGTTWNYEG